MNWSLPGSSVRGIFQATVLEWVPSPSPIVPGKWISWTTVGKEANFCLVSGGSLPTPTTLAPDICLLPVYWCCLSLVRSLLFISPVASLFTNASLVLPWKHFPHESFLWFPTTAESRKSVRKRQKVSKNQSPCSFTPQHLQLILVSFSTK